MSQSAAFMYGSTVIYSSTAVGSETGSAFLVVPSPDDDVRADRFEMAVWATQTITGSSTPLMDLTLQCSPDGTNWYDAAAWTQLTSSLLTKNECKVAAIQGRYVRVVRTASGTIATYTGSVTLTANGKFRATEVT